MSASLRLGSRIDRHILGRFLGDFVLLFAMLFAFATLIDAVLRLEDFRRAAHAVDPEGGWWNVLLFIAQFHGPRIFQFYQYLFGLVAVAAAGFTVARMQKDRELIAMVATGIPLQRAALPIILGAACLCGLQVANQELVLPRLADRLQLELMPGARKDRWDVPLAVGGNGTLLRAAHLDQASGTLEGVVVYERDGSGQIARRIASPRATWSATQGGWLLDQARVEDRRSGIAAPEDPAAKGAAAATALIRTDLSPDALALRGDAISAHLISTGRLRQMRSANAIAAGPYRHLVGSRIAVLVVNVALLCISLPFLLRREPGSLLPAALRSAAVMVPLGIASLGALAVPNPWLGPALGLMLPIAVLVPLAAWRLAAMDT